METANPKYDGITVNWYYDEDLIGDDENKIFKLWPTASDRQAFKSAMHNSLEIMDYEDSLIVQAHEFFTTRIKEWLGSAPALVQPRAEALETTITSMIQFSLEIEDASANHDKIHLHGRVKSPVSLLVDFRSP